MPIPNQNADQPDLRTNAGEFFNEYTTGMLWDNLNETLVMVIASEEFQAATRSEQAELVQFIVRSHELLHDLHDYLDEEQQAA